MSAVEAPPTKPPVEARRCPRCGADLTPEQEWCLSCGADVASTIAQPPSWRGPVALVAGLLAIALAALILALVELAGDAEQVGPQAATPTATPPPAVAPTVTPESTTIPPATDNPSTTPEIADWPAGKEAWTVVLESSSTEDAARARAEELIQQGIPVGLLNSDDYGSLEPGRWVVFSGQYDSRRAAEQGLADLQGQVAGAYVRHVAPDASAGNATATPSPTTAPTTEPTAVPTL